MVCDPRVAMPLVDFLFFSRLSQGSDTRQFLNGGHRFVVVSIVFSTVLPRVTC